MTLSPIENEPNSLNFFKNSISDLSIILKVLFFKLF